MCIVLCLLVSNSASAALSPCTASFVPCLCLLSFLVHVSLLSLSSQSSSLEGREGPTITIPGDLSLSITIKKCDEGTLRGIDLVALVLARRLGFLVCSLAALPSSCLFPPHTTLHLHLAHTSHITHAGEQDVPPC